MVRAEHIVLIAGQRDVHREAIGIERAGASGRPRVHAGREVVGRIQPRPLGIGQREPVVRIAERVLQVEVADHDFDEVGGVEDRRVVAGEHVLRRPLLGGRQGIGVGHPAAGVVDDALVVEPESAQLAGVAHLVGQPAGEVANAADARVRESRHHLGGGVILIRPEIPQLVRLDRPAGVGVHVPQHRQRDRAQAEAGQLGRDIAADHRLLDEAVVAPGLEPVAPRFRDDVDVGAAAAADVGAHRRRIDRELVGRIHVDVVHLAVVLRRVRRDAEIVHRERVDAVADHEVLRRRVDAARVLPRIHHRRRQRRRAVDLFAGGHRFEERRVEPRRDLLVLHVHGRRGAGDGDGFLHAGNLHGDVDRHGRAGGDDDLLPDQRGEAGELELHLIRPGVDAGEPVMSFRVGHRAPDAHDRRAGQRHGDARQHAASVVADLADDLPEDLAGLRAHRSEPEREDESRGGISVMYVWYRARKIKNRYVEFVRVEEYIPKLEELSNDNSVPKYATHLVYLTSANNPKEIEHKIIYSILSGKPKRADIYWFVHVDTLDDPYTCEYTVEHIIPNDIIRVEFRLGFRIAPRLNLMFKKVVEDLVANREVNIMSRYESQQRNNMVGDFQFIVMEKFLSQDNELPFFEEMVMKIYFWLKELSVSEERSFGLEQSNVAVEKFPLVVAPVSKLKLSRIWAHEDEDEE